MSDLLQLPPELLERVINKLECKSYFRLQQTCHDMADFIQNNRQIKAWMSDFILTIKAHDTIPSCYISSRNRNGIIIEAGPRDKCNLFELRNLFGLHFGIVQIEQNFERAERSYLVNCCNMLKDYRITASIFDTSEMRASQLSHELYVDFLKVLKPVKIDLDSRGANLYEGLLKAKTLKNVDISLRLKDMPDLMIMNDLLGMFSKLSVTMRTEADFMKCLDVAKTFMQYLREPRPNLRSFIFEASYQGHYIPLPSLEEILHLLQDFDPILERDDKPRIRWWPNSFKCRLKPGSRFCRLVFNGTVEITFIDYMTLDEFGQLKT